MHVLVASHPSALEHDTGPRHPERPDRVRAVQRGVTVSGLDVTQIEAPRIERSELAIAHDANYIETVETVCSLGGGAFDMDTVASEGTWEAALTAAGGVRVLTEELEARADSVGFALCRPPGHHALPNRAMGFCFFNNVAVTASLLRSRGSRVAVLDWDVHHGNGTQAILGDDPGTLYVSIHQDHFYPFEGRISDIDAGDSKGTNVNVPLPAGTRGDVYRRAWGELVVPILSQFAPDWVFVSAGYDAHADDPLGGMALRDDDYGWMAARLAAVHPGSRTVVALEGGYDLDALEGGTSSTLLGLAGIAAWGDGEHVSPASASDALGRAIVAAGRHWDL